MELTNLKCEKAKPRTVPQLYADVSLARQSVPGQQNPHDCVRLTHTIQLVRVILFPGFCTKSGDGGVGESVKACGGECGCTTHEF